MEGVTTIQLPQCLKILEGEAEETVLFVNPTETLETFFNYKGKLCELNKCDLRIKMGKETKEEVSEQVRQLIVHGLKYGEWMVMSAGKASSMNFSEFFSQFSFNNGDMGLFDNSKILTKEYIMKMGILKNEEDIDVFNNTGMYSIKESARIFYYSSCSADEIATIKSSNPGINFKIYLVE